MSVSVVNSDLMIDLGTEYSVDNLVLAYLLAQEKNLSDSASADQLGLDNEALLSVLESRSLPLCLDRLMTGFVGRDQSDPVGSFFFDTFYPNRVVSGAFVDLDYFGNINEHHGFNYGSAVMGALAPYFIGSLDDKIAAPLRIGGDEIFLLVEGSRQEVAHLVHNAAHSFASLVVDGYSAEHGPPQLRISGGVADTTELERPDYFSLRALAEHRQDLAKSNGRGRVVFANYEPSTAGQYTVLAGLEETTLSLSDQ